MGLNPATEAAGGTCAQYGPPRAGKQPFPREIRTTYSSALPSTRLQRPSPVPEPVVPTATRRRRRARRRGRDPGSRGRMLAMVVGTGADASPAARLALFDLRRVVRRGAIDLASHRAADGRAIRALNDGLRTRPPVGVSPAVHSTTTHRRALPDSKKAHPCGWALSQPPKRTGGTCAHYGPPRAGRQPSPREIWTSARQPPDAQAPTAQPGWRLGSGQARRRLRASASRAVIPGAQGRASGRARRSRQRSAGC